MKKNVVERRYCIGEEDEVEIRSQSRLPISQVDPWAIFNNLILIFDLFRPSTHTKLVSRWKAR